ncbi:MAG: hypothetical protein AAF960_18130 [Bacteroidota bacterium]
MSYVNLATKQFLLKGSLVLITTFLLTNCNPPKPTNQAPPQTLPNNPESVSKRWQLHLDHNEIEKAMLLSTDRTKAWLSKNTDLFLDDQQVYQTEFVKMDCQITEDKAKCTYVIKGEMTEEDIEDYFLLKKVNNQWLVDLEEESASPELDEQIFNEMEKELKLD